MSQLHVHTDEYNDANKEYNLFTSYANLHCDGDKKRLWLRYSPDGTKKDAIGVYGLNNARENVGNNAKHLRFYYGGAYWGIGRVVSKVGNKEEVANNALANDGWKGIVNAHKSRANSFVAMSIKVIQQNVKVTTNTVWKYTQTRRISLNQSSYELGFVTMKNNKNTAVGWRSTEVVSSAYYNNTNDANYQNITKIRGAYALGIPDEPNLHAKTNAASCWGLTNASRGSYFFAASASSLKANANRGPSGNAVADEPDVNQVTKTSMKITSSLTYIRTLNHNPQNDWNVSKCLVSRRSKVFTRGPYQSYLTVYKNANGLKKTSKNSTYGYVKTKDQKTTTMENNKKVNVTVKTTELADKVDQKSDLNDGKLSYRRSGSVSSYANNWIYTVSRQLSNKTTSFGAVWFSRLRRADVWEKPQIIGNQTYMTKDGKTYKRISYYTTVYFQPTKQ